MLGVKIFFAQYMRSSFTKIKKTMVNVDLGSILPTYLRTAFVHADPKRVKRLMT